MVSPSFPSDFIFAAWLCMISMVSERFSQPRPLVDAYFADNSRSAIPGGN